MNRYCIECRVRVVTKPNTMCLPCVKEDDAATIKAIGPRGWNTTSRSFRCARNHRSPRYVGPRALSC